MELYLDTSDVVAVKALSRIFPLAGVTTNPSIIAAGKKPLEVVLPQLHEAMGGQGRLFAQVMATTAEGMVNDARKLRSIIADIVVKVPVTAEGLAAIKMLKAEGIPTLGTAVYGAAQGLLSALAGDAPRDKCTLSCAINGIHAAFHYLKKNYISGCVMTVPTGW